MSLIKLPLPKDFIMNISGMVNSLNNRIYSEKFMYDFKNYYLVLNNRMYK